MINTLIKVYNRSTKSKQLYLFHNEAGSKTQHTFIMKLSGSNTQHIFFMIGIFKDVVAGSNAQHIFVTMNLSTSFVVDVFLLGFCFACLFCFLLCFLVDKINVRPCVRPTATTNQTPVMVTSCSHEATILKKLKHVCSPMPLFFFPF